MPMESAGETTLTSVTQGLMHMSEASEPSAPSAASDARGDGEHAHSQPSRAADRRQQRRWVPITIGWLCFWIGLADVVNSAIPRLGLEHRLHRISPFVQGVLTNVTATADAIIGLHPPQYQWPGREPPGRAGVLRGDGCGRGRPLGRWGHGS